MKEKVLKKIVGGIEFIGEKALEWIEYARSHLTKGKGVRSICEEYSIKEEFLKQEYVKEFLEERRKAGVRNGYKVEINDSYSSEKKEEIGCVTLLCRGRHIDQAILTTGGATGEKQRLIHWNFNKQ